MKIGILALQGDFYKHGEAVQKLGHDVLYIKDLPTLKKSDKLIIPGGESTTFLRLIEKLKLRDPLIEFGRTKSIMGTCAGLITVATQVDGLPFPPLGLIDIKVERNAYGTQIDSFIDEVRLDLSGDVLSFEGIFIRAPKIEESGRGVREIGWHKEAVVMVANENILASTFHPELSNDLQLHKFFINNFN
ncbi:MAG: pyridoxal 5'-phosphate synthase glutaminase subunit PdxT [Deltaproteobacteria bacterium]|nr:pyridoxal 5'-phosphate synthase glutaminase subunit PdxT [Deltaproteobacteria bacterium]